MALAANDVKFDQSIVIIGSGATARAVVAAIDSDKSIQNRRIDIVHRNPGRESDMRKAAPASELIFHNWDSGMLLNEASLIVNTSPTGVADVFCKIGTVLIIR